MHEPAPPLHPLFDAASLYSQMRAGLRPEDKIRGYFHWLMARARRLAQTDPAVATRPTVRTREVRVGRPILAILQVELVVVGGLTGAWLRYLQLSLHQSGRARPAHYLQIVRESDGTPTLGLVVIADPQPRPPTRIPYPRRDPSGERPHCRAFLIEPEVVARLRTVLGEAALNWEREQLLQATFGAETILGHFEVARILSALPELEGELDPRTWTFEFQRLPLPPQCETFPPRSDPLAVVLALQPSPSEDYEDIPE